MGVFSQCSINNCHAVIRSRSAQLFAACSGMGSLLCTSSTLQEKRRHIQRAKKLNGVKTTTTNIGSHLPWVLSSSGLASFGCKILSITTYMRTQIQRRETWNNKRLRQSRARTSKNSYICAEARSVALTLLNQESSRIETKNRKEKKRKMKNHFTTFKMKKNRNRKSRCRPRLRGSNCL